MRYKLNLIEFVEIFTNKCLTAEQVVYLEGLWDGKKLYCFESHKWECDEIFEQYLEYRRE